MNKDEFDNLANEMNRDLEHTIEISSLEDLANEAIEAMEEENAIEKSDLEQEDISESIVDDAIDDANLVFETQIKTEEKMKKEK